MEQKTVIKENEDKTYSKTTTKITNPSDGFVHQPDINTTDRGNYGEYHKGWQIDKHYETDNPKIVIPFLIIFMILILLIPIGVYFMDISDNHIIFYVFLVGSVLFEILLIKEIINVINKKK